MTRDPTDDIMHAYFGWLYYQVLRIYDRKSPLSYVRVLEAMHEMKFDDSTPNDDNRARDGIELRDEFISSLKNIDVEDYTQLQSFGGCSVLEMLVALTRRADYIVENGQEWWFKTFMLNLGLWKYNDSTFVPRHGMKVQEILTNFNRRNYTRSGKGGIFPLNRPRTDQRSKELWYQMSAYITENQMY